MAAIDLMSLLEWAYDAGFQASGEGYNAEYPFNFDENAIQRELSESRQAKLEEILQSVEVQ